MARSRAQLTLVPAPDLTHDDRTSADGCVTGSLFGDAPAPDAPALTATTMSPLLGRDGVRGLR